MKFFDLFAGIGGFRIAMEKNGHKCVGGCECSDTQRYKQIGNAVTVDVVELIASQI